MAKELSRSKKVASKALYAALNIVKQNGGSMRGFDVIEKIANTVTFDEWENHQYKKTGYIRWKSILHFYTIDCVKAGFLQKSKGLWTLTPEGEEALKKGADELLSLATKAYRSWAGNKKESEETSDVSEKTDEGEEIIEQTQKAILEQYEESAFQGIREFILRKNPYEFQNTVAALLIAMGYYISMISPKGKDGGIDIIAYTDPLGTKPPRIIVQVKHKPESSISSDEIQKLIGTMKRESDVGIFATSGDFSQPAKLEARLSGKHIELIDFDRFIDLWIQYYDKMSDENKTILPLHPVYFLGSNE